MPHEPNVFPVNCDLPEPITSMLDDFTTMTNHMIAFGLHKKVGLTKHYYPLAEGDKSGRPKPIPADRELRDLAKPWFVKTFGKKYQIHYLDSAASFAQQHISSWRALGGNIAAVPYIRNKTARLNNDLWRIISIQDGMMTVHIKVAPCKSETLTFQIHHRKAQKWLKHRRGPLQIVPTTDNHPSGLRMVFIDDSPKGARPKKTTALDTNFDRIIAARSDGEFLQINTRNIEQIQKNGMRKNSSIQKTLAHRPQKRDRILARRKGRTHNRIEDNLHKTLHGKESAFKAFVSGSSVHPENLHTINKNVLKNDRGKRFNGRMTRWVHGLTNDILHHHFEHTKQYYTRGTSGFCPFDNTLLVNTKDSDGRPVWRQLYCKTENTIYDRDWLEALNGLVRVNSKHVKGEKWATVSGVFPKSIADKLKSNIMVAPFSVPEGPAQIRGLSSANGPKSVHPEWAVLYPEGQSVLGTSPRIGARLGNRDKDWPQSAKSSGNDAKIVGQLAT